MVRNALMLCTLTLASVACDSDANPSAVDAAAPSAQALDASQPGLDSTMALPVADAGRPALDAAQAPPEAGSPSAPRGDAGAQTDASPSGADSTKIALAELDAYLAMPRAQRPPLAEQAFATVPLTKDAAAAAEKKLWGDFAAGVRTERASEVGATESTARAIKLDNLTLRYYLARSGGTPSGGPSLFISMHGGGSAPAATNDSQWRNQIALVSGYKPVDAIWVAPRAPVDDWNMWFVAGIDALIERLITNMIVFEGVNPNKVYINGYSAGGDGVYQLGPRMGERWAGAGMSAGHPNAASPLSLRNVPFAIHVGGDDTAFDRNLKAREWGMRLESLAAADPGGYDNQWQVHAGRPHWMELDDAVSIPFLQRHTRDPIPKKIVWEQADVPRAHFYWLAVDAQNRAKGSLLTAHYDEGGITIEKAEGVHKLSVRLS
ncbi:MAG: hypothetical protein RL385_3718, partial [Pseudomonadota bacterium]